MAAEADINNKEEEEEEEYLEMLRSTIERQQKLLHKLYTELEAEREASSTAATEAMSMILRLQEEKAAEILQATQFKRLIQEKMNHANHVFEQTLRNKDLEIASLQFQLQQSYSPYKMPSCLSSDSIDLQDMECLGDSIHPGYNVTRMQSLPAIQFKELIPNKGGIIYRDKSEVKLPDIDQDQDKGSEANGKDVNIIPEESAMPDLASHWEQIKDLDQRANKLSLKSIESERVDDLSRGQVNSRKGRRGGAGSSLSSLKSVPTGGVAGNKLDCMRTLSCSISPYTDPDKLLPSDHSSVPCSKQENIGSSSLSLSIYDVFEVPQNSDESKLCHLQNQGGKVLALDKENRLGKPDPLPHGLTKDSCKDEAGWTKSLLQYAEDERKWTNVKKGISVQSHLGLVGSTNGAFPLQTDFQQLTERVGKLEENRIALKQGVPDHGELNWKLLKEIHEQLNAIQSEIRRDKPETCPVANEPSLVSIMEELFFYSL
ncbi:hypothetical protein ACHQM5_030723 [Ranunculus cassubicifolius]